MPVRRLLVLRVTNARSASGRTNKPSISPQASHPLTPPYKTTAKRMLTLSRPVVGQPSLRQQRQAVEQGIDLHRRLVDRDHHGPLAVAETVEEGGEKVCVFGRGRQHVSGVCHAFAMDRQRRNKQSTCACVYARTPARRASAPGRWRSRGRWWVRPGRGGRGGRSPVS